jgi:hypothetical protein
VADLNREDGELLTRIESDFPVERRAHGPSADGYIVIVTWQASAGRTEWSAVDRWELSPTMQESLARALARHGVKP